MKTNGIHWFPLCIPPTPRQNLPSAGFLFLFLAFSECAARPRLSMRLLHLAMMSCANPRKIPTKGVNLKEKEKKSKDQQRDILFTLLHIMPKTAIFRYFYVHFFKKSTKFFSWRTLCYFHRSLIGILCYYNAYSGVHAVLVVSTVDCQCNMLREPRRSYGRTQDALCAWQFYAEPMVHQAAYPCITPPDRVLIGLAAVLPMYCSDLPPYHHRQTVGIIGLMAIFRAFSENFGWRWFARGTMPAPCYQNVLTLV